MVSPFTSSMIKPQREAATKMFCSFFLHLFPEPPSEPTQLFVLTPNQIYKIILPSNNNNNMSMDSDEIENPSQATVTQMLNLKDVITMEVNFKNRSLCYLINFDITCVNVSNINDQWQMPKPDFLPLYESEFFALLFVKFIQQIYIK